MEEENEAAAIVSHVQLSFFPLEMKFEFITKFLIQFTFFSLSLPSFPILMLFYLFFVILLLLLMPLGEHPAAIQSGNKIEIRLYFLILAFIALSTFTSSVQR